jgi:hypothetical protein
MRDEEWIKALGDGRRVKFIYQELPEDGAFITAQFAGNEVNYSNLALRLIIMLTLYLAGYYANNRGFKQH